MKDQIEIQVISSETIKPSSPTPNHLRHYKLSFLDQIAPPTFMPTVLFFPEDDHSELSIFTRKKLLDQLKKSLSEALALFYPLAGRINVADLCVDCNDEGALFVEADAKSCCLSDVLRDPNPSQMNDFLAVEIDDVRVKELPVAVQATFFSCGGMTVSLCINHKVADALSYFKFLNAWSAFARSGAEKEAVAPPTFRAAELFPAIDLSGFKSGIGIVRDKIVAKRFVFDDAKISELKVKYKCGDENERRPTRVEALSAFLWHRLVASTKPNDDDHVRVCTLQHAMNLRTRMDPPLPESFFGNVTRTVVSTPTVEAAKDGSYDIVRKMRDSIKQIDAESVKQLQNKSDGHLSFLKQRLELVKRGEVVSISFTSLCRFPIYDADFGWGKPAYVGSARVTFKNLVSFFDTKSGYGIEAWVNLKEEDMAKFDSDEELLSYVSPSTLNVLN